ncbi:heterokaryon incompatibility protein-domain-containing protein [Hyaloscypha sp. PMI_1271]|nr:heterokaryon incompatibility protein-domain-containing protein [Hyaloscypha sp. PMI_1271]
MNAISNHFKYAPLETSSSSSSFRLLILQPAENLTEPLVCDLIHETLDTEIPYDCISYVWGVDAPSKPIRINEVDLLIRENLWNGLKRLRLKTLTRRIWADALCVNQMDLRERTSQVAMMRDIYANANEVAIWLGERLQPRNSTENIENCLRQWADQDESWDFSVLKVDENALGDFESWFRSPWWTRLWVLQEAAVCRRDPVLYYGGERVVWELFSRFWETRDTLGNLIRRRGPEPNVQHENLRALLQRKFDGIHAIRARFQGNICQSLQDIVARTERRSCTDPRDRYFALLGLTLPPCPIEADYTLDSDTVYHIYKMHSLSPLSTYDECCAEGSRRQRSTE